jgi:anthranilate phosphoribosyltransferase
MIPTWVAVVAGISLAILALSAIAIAVSSVAAALGVRAFLHVLRDLAGPAVGDVRQLVGTIRTEAESLAGTSRELRQRIVKAADAAQTRLADLDALFEVVQEEVESTVLDAAASVRMVRRGLSLVDWGRRALKRGRKH